MVENRIAPVVEASRTALVLAGPSGLVEMANDHLEISIPERFRHRHRVAVAVTLVDRFVEFPELSDAGEP